MMYSACKLNKQGDNIRLWCTFPIWNQSVVPCPVLTVASWPAYRFLKRQVRWSGIPIYLRISTVYCDPHTKAEIDVLLDLSCFFHDPADVGNLTSGSSAFSKSRLYNWNFSVHELLKPSLKDFEQNLTSVRNEYTCMVVWTFFGTAILWDWNENSSFLVLWPRLSFPNFLAYWVQHFRSLIF